jgi:hypothetical protein
VVRDGQIVEQGSHSELISRPEGAYSVLVGLQMRALRSKQEGVSTSVSQIPEEGGEEGVVFGEEEGGADLVLPLLPFAWLNRGKGVPLRRGGSRLPTAFVFPVYKGLWVGEVRGEGKVFYLFMFFFGIQYSLQYTVLHIQCNFFQCILMKQKFWKAFQ